MIFPKIFTENILQVKDKTRLAANDSFRLDSAPLITDVLIQPETTGDFVSVFNGGDSKKWHLDWAYDVPEDKIVTVKIIDENLDEYFEVSAVKVLSSSEDYLYSNDNDLVAIEHDIKRYIPKGRNTWKDKHRLAQSYIIDHLNDEGITDQKGERLTKVSIIDIREINEWSKYKTLEFIYEDIKVTAEDVFSEKATKYMLKAEGSAKKAFIRLDTSGNGEEDIKKNLLTARMIRRWLTRLENTLKIE